MGTTQSTHTTPEIKEPSYPEKAPDSSVSGRKESTEAVLDERNTISTNDGDDVSVTSSEDSYSSDEESEEEDEEWNERVRILQDAKNLRMLAADFLHPEKSVVTSDPCATGRNFFTRASADEYEEEDDMDDRDDILADLKELKIHAEAYMMPETPVVCNDPCAMGRNYFNRSSAPETEDPEEAEQRAQILEDAKNLGKLAVDFMQPELSAEVTDPSACGRNYFTRPSAPDMDTENEEERSRILAEMEQMKQLAVDFMHPEKSVVSSDPCATARSFFSRPSAPEYEEEDDMDDREDILSDLAELKAQAEAFMMPEMPVKVDPLSTCRNYFDRASAPDSEIIDEAAERAQILADAQSLKQTAVDFMQPELPVKTTDPFACGRNYMSRPSAPSQEEIEEAEERARILADMKQLKQLSVDYLQPELPVSTTDPFATGRNYFTRPSAPTEESDDEERERILAEAKQMKQVAADYLHPELPVASDAFATGRNFFSRPSADEYEEEDDMDDREDILADLQELKAQAEVYMMPEKPVEVDPVVTCRNYFERASAPEVESTEEEEERARVLSDAAALKKTAVDYMCPEAPVVCDDPCSMGRNYFSRPAAFDTEDAEEAEERAQILADALQLKNLAGHYMSPELPVETTDAYACGRNFFSRPSATEYEDAEEADERAQALADVASLKETAVHYMCPEKSVVSSDPAATGRNYFGRSSAPEYDDAERSEERALALADAQQLKKTASDYLAPGPVDVDPTAMARCYFDRPSAGGHADHIHSQGHSLSHGGHVVHDYHGHDAAYYHGHHGHDDHSIQSEHFEMDEDAVYHDIRASLQMSEPFKGEHPKEAEAEGEEGKLSRSPSCVMLFDEAAM